MSQKKMLILSGSPRKNGMVYQMLKEAADEGERQGFVVQFHQLYEEELKPCIGCMACRKNGGTCVLNDAVTDITRELRECDLLVIGSPTYFANVSAPVKTVFDRLAGVVMDDNDSPIPKPLLRKEQQYILMTACNTPFPFDHLAGQSTGCIKAMREVCHISGMRMAGKVIAAGTRRHRDIPIRKIQKLVCRAASRIG